LRQIPCFLSVSTLIFCGHKKSLLLYFCHNQKRRNKKRKTSTIRNFHHIFFQINNSEKNLEIKKKVINILLLLFSPLPFSTDNQLFFLNCFFAHCLKIHCQKH
jgi:hypothetical protein